MEFVTTVNRTSKDLWATWDGKKYKFEPHQKLALPLAVAEAARRQNPIMGSEDPYFGTMKYLIGIEEQGDDCSPVEPSNEITRRSLEDLKKQVPADQKLQVVKGDNGIYSVRDIQSSLPLDSNFVKP